MNANEVTIVNQSPVFSLGWNSETGHQYGQDTWYSDGSAERRCWNEAGEEWFDNENVCVVEP